MTRLMTAGFAFAAVLAFQPLMAAAQTSAPAPAAPAAPVAAPRMAAPAAADPALPKDAATRMEQHNKQLHDDLGITAAQQPLWDQFAQVMMNNATVMHRSFAGRRAGFATMNAADNMQSYADLAQLHAANMEKSAAAFQTLYATFSPQQKAAADKVFRADMAKHHSKHS